MYTWILGGCDIWSPKVLRSSMGTCLRLPVVEMSWMDTIKCISELNASLIARNTLLQIVIADSIRENDKDSSKISSDRYDKIDYTLPTVLVIGSEATGVSQEAFNLPGLNQ